ncbi:Mov34/MPN/PAD-1 family protein [Rhodoferax mekongensis]|uniref:Mov34/MPN/PAD-1 family protein n=1 Tax=Rhodoferax mekongensis TaxID=3068341 RepID=A0ABZ0AWH5_9BURK|nr:Mov34/MPN/PAD-1 family protein [Rhodoferax sp. TBRC 17307]WNO03997.1 Mov34/MPN/PAD-1 family protein [Rhodoferax sp. TBRC 17307]
MLVHKLEISKPLWQQLIRDLARTGMGVKESGAFLLGNMEPSRVVTEYLLYSDIAPDSQHVNYVLLRGRHMAKVWDICELRKLRVVADIHTHPGVPIQSPSDRDNPIVSIAGHVALIVPNFAKGLVVPSSLGFHEFQGQGEWRSWFRGEAAALLNITG